MDTNLKKTSAPEHPPNLYELKYLHLVLAPLYLLNAQSQMSPGFRKVCICSWTSWLVSSSDKQPDFLCWPLTDEVLQKRHWDTASSSLSPSIFGLYVITAGHFPYSSGGRYTLEADVCSDCLAAEGVLLEPEEQD